MGLAGLVLIGLSNGYLRSYHLRILAVPLAVAAGLGLARGVVPRTHRRSGCGDALAAP